MMMEPVKSNAAEYFRQLSPLKIESRRKSRSPPKENQNGRSGRCHCCPYGYHIDLDFVRYCQSLEKGTKNDNPAVTELKKMKKERRRQRKSMEVMLGISPVENGTHITTLPTTIENRAPVNAAGRKLTPAPLSNSFRSPPSPPPRKSSLTHPYLQSPNPPDIINSSNLVCSRRSELAADALKEAVQNFEETLERSNSLKRTKKYVDPSLMSIDLLHHTPSNYGPKTPSVARSNSLPRQFGRCGLQSTKLIKQITSYPSGSDEDLYASDNVPSEYGLYRTNGWNTMPQSNYNQSTLIYDAMASLEAAHGTHEFDTLSMASGVSGVSTATLQSIREQMATGLSRLKELEGEVKKVPSMQLKMNILKEQNRLLIEQVKSLKNGAEPTSLSLLDVDGDFSEDELESRLSLLRRRGDRSSSNRKRSPSPLRVNLEDFRSYRRARASSMSEGSDTESIHSYRTKSKDRNDTKLHISESTEEKRRPFIKRTRDVGVGCKVTTRDVGCTYVAPRLRSIGIGTYDPLDRKKEVTAKPCLQCHKRNQRTFENKAIEANDSISHYTTSMEDNEDDTKSLLHKLGKKSALISRLSEPQLYPPVLTFDNATNTEPIRTRDRQSNTTGDVYTKSQLDELIEKVKLQWTKTTKHPTRDNGINTEPLPTRDIRSNTIEDIYTKTQLDELIEEAKSQWMKTTTKHPKLTRNSGSQTIENVYTKPQLDEHVEIAKSQWTKTTTHPKLTRDSGSQTLNDTVKTYNIGVQCKPSTRDCGINFVEIIEKPRTRSIGIETHFDVVQTRSVACETHNEIPRKRTVACGTSDHFRLLYKTVGVGTDRIDDQIQTKTVGCQVVPLTKPIETVTSIATPEVERRPFGSTGVNICDKCHEAITSVAKGIVGPLPVQPSKIPRLIDQPKVEEPKAKSLQETRSLPIPTIKTKSPSPPPRKKSLSPPRKPVSQEDFSSNVSSSIPSITSSPQVKRVPLLRQETYTKDTDGFVNLAFEDHKNKRSPSPPKRRSPKRSITKSQLSKHPPKTIREVSIEGSPVIGDDQISISSCDEETGDDSSAISPSHSVRSMTYSISTNASLPPLSQSSSATAVGPDGKTRKKSIPTRNMKAALKVLNDSIGKPARSGQQLTNAVNIVQKEWFKISSDKDSNPVTVEEYMDAFEDFSKRLLQRIVNLADTNGNTAMHYAVSNGNFDVVSVLLDSKVCNINQQNKAGYTACMLVALAQIKDETQEGVVNRLFQMSDVNIKASQHGQTALMLAVSHGRLDMVRMLISAGADVNIHDEDGSTALMCAAEHGHLAIVKFLSAQPDTDLYLMDNDGSTALTIAVEAGHKDVGVLLYKQMNLSRVASPYSSVRGKRSRTPTMHRTPGTPPPRNSAPPSPGRSRKSSGRTSPAPRQSSASLSNLII